MPAVGYVRSMEMRRDIESRYGESGVSRRAARGCEVTITIDIIDWEGGRPNVMLMLAGETVAVQVLPEIIVGSVPPAKKKRQRKERVAPSSPCLPLPAPREPSRWDYLEVE